MTVDGGDDGALVLAARAGDEQAFGRLFDQWFDPVHDIAWRIVRDRDTAADVAQDVFLAAWRGLDDLEQPGSFGGWVRRIARNKALNRLARERRSRPDSDAAAAELDRTAPDVDMTAALEEREQNELVWAASAALGERDASLLDLHLRHGLPPADIAAELGVTTNNAHQLLHRLKGKLGGAIRAWVVWRRSGACADLDRAVADAGVTSFGAEALRVVDRHVRDCDACQERQELRLAPEALFSALPIAVAPPSVKIVAASALSADGVPMTGSTSGPVGQSAPGESAEPADGGGSGDGGDSVDAGPAEGAGPAEPAGQAEPADPATSGDAGETGLGEAAAESPGPGDGSEISEPAESGGGGSSEAADPGAGEAAAESAGPGGGDSAGAGDPGGGETAAESAGPEGAGVSAEPAESGGREAAGSGSGDAGGGVASGEGAEVGGAAPVSGNGQTPAEGAVAPGGSGPLAVAAGSGAATRTGAPPAKGDAPAARRRTLVLVGLAVLTAVVGILVLLTSGGRDDVATSADRSTTSSSTSSTSTSTTVAGEGDAGATPPADGQGPATSPPTTAAPSTEPSAETTTTTEPTTTTSANTTTTTEPDPAPVIVRFAASPPGSTCGSTRSAGDVNLAWAAENATEVSLADVNGLPPSGSIVVCAAPGDTFTLQATGPGGAAEAHTTVPPG